MIQKLKLNKEFRRVYGRGKSFVHPAVVTYVFKNRSNSIRIGITVSKKLGSAVYRNRAKRLISAAVRECMPFITPGADIVFVARTRIFSHKSTDIAVILKKHFVSAGIWKENDS